MEPFRFVKKVEYKTLTKYKVVIIALMVVIKYTIVVENKNYPYADSSI